MFLDSTLHNIQNFMVWIKGKMEQSKKWRSALAYISVLQLLKWVTLD